jgi:hypothetical protein
LNEELRAVRAVLKRRRYWEPRPTPQPIEKGGIQQLCRLVEDLHAKPNTRKFRSMFRMDPPDFDALLSVISQHENFQNRSINPQLNPRYQLAVFLHRLGSPGGFSQEDTSTLLHLGEGTVSLYCNRVLGAIHSWKDTYVKWPTPAQRQETSARIAEKSANVFEDVVGFIDGTFLVLKYAPQIDHVYYFNRKHNYALNATIVCDDTRKILWIRAGDTSAVHDARVFSRSFLAQQPEAFFSAHEYLLGDSAYTPTSHMVTPFKKPRANHSDEAQFNSTLSAQRVVVEHIFGQLKARFPALTSISIRIKSLKDHQRIVEWFEVAGTLHNFLHDRKAPEWTTADDLERADKQQRRINRLQTRNDREDIFRQVIDNEDEATREYLFSHFKRKLHHVQA